MIELCERCGINPKAINYKKGDRTFYRSLCDACIIEKKKNVKPLWQQEGYKKKFKCESCGFVAKFPEQLDVVDYINAYRTICLNCKVSFDKEKKITILKGDLRSDF
jgi:hypothetical protein